MRDAPPLHRRPCLKFAARFASPESIRLGRLESQIQSGSRPIRAQLHGSRQPGRRCEMAVEDRVESLTRPPVQLEEELQREARRPIPTMPRSGASSSPKSRTPWSVSATEGPRFQCTRYNAVLYLRSWREAQRLTVTGATEDGRSRLRPRMRCGPSTESHVVRRCAASCRLKRRADNRRLG